jgi:hypothetical protein
MEHSGDLYLKQSIAERREIELKLSHIHPPKELHMAADNRRPSARLIRAGKISVVSRKPSAAKKKVATAKRARVAKKI